jgi:hypothetical protein
MKNFSTTLSIRKYENSTPSTNKTTHNGKTIYTYLTSAGFRLTLKNLKNNHAMTGKAKIKPAKKESFILTLKASVSPVTIKF